MLTLSIKDIVKNNTAKFSHYRKGFCYYTVETSEGIYMFPVSIEDIGDATLLPEFKAITLMRYIRKAVESENFVKVG